MGLQKRWGFHIFLKPHKIKFVDNNSLYSLQTKVCNLLSNIALKMSYDRKKSGSLRTRYPHPSELYASQIFKNGIEEGIENKEDNEQKMSEVQSFLSKLLEDDNQSNDKIMNKVRKCFSNASASHSIVIQEKDENAFGAIPHFFKIKVLNDANEPQPINKQNCLIEARLFTKTLRIPRDEECDWTKTISWSHYEATTMKTDKGQIKMSQFAMCYNQKDTIYFVGGYKEGNVDSKDCYKYNVDDDKYEKIASLKFEVKNHCIGMLKDGRIVSMGGNKSHFAIYSPSKNEWNYALNTDENKKEFGAGSMFVISQNKDSEDIIHCIGGSKWTDDDD